MIVRPSLAWAALTLGLLLGSFTSVRAQDFTSSEHHFSLKLPAGWGKVPADAIRTMNQEMRRRLPNAPLMYHTGFQLKNQPPLSYPYVLI